MAHSDLEQRLSDLQSNLDTTVEELETQKALNAKLEDDLLRVNSHPTTYAGSVVASTRYTFRPPATNRPSSPTSSIIGTRDDVISKSGATEPSILPIITQQRDRFRVRNAELEADMRKQLTIISSLRGEIQTLQKDNLGLYEKVRFLQQYTKNPVIGDVSSMEEGEGASGSSRSGAGVGMERYRSAYEESITPFEAFRGKLLPSVKSLLMEGISESIPKPQSTRENCIQSNESCIGESVLEKRVLCILYWIAFIGGHCVILAGNG